MVSDRLASSFSFSRGVCEGSAYLRFGNQVAFIRDGSIIDRCGSSSVGLIYGVLFLVESIADFLPCFVVCCPNNPETNYNRAFAVQ
jgi:hypothetical protein